MTTNHTHLTDWKTGEGRAYECKRIVLLCSRSIFLASFLRPLLLHRVLGPVRRVQPHDLLEPCQQCRRRLVIVLYGGPVPRIQSDRWLCFRVRGKQRHKRIDPTARNPVGVCTEYTKVLVVCSTAAGREQIRRVIFPECDGYSVLSVRIGVERVAILRPTILAAHHLYFLLSSLRGM